MPNDGVLVRNYVMLLQKKLYMTRANFGRIAILPSTATNGETVLSLHSDGRQPDQAMITCTKAASNLWSEAHALNVDLKLEPRVRVRRIDVPITKTLAIAIADEMSALLEKTRRSGMTNQIVVDGTDFLVSLDSATGQHREGVLRPDSTGANSTALRRLAFMLDQYCTTDDRARSGVASKIERELHNFER